MKNFAFRDTVRLVVYFGLFGLMVVLGLLRAYSDVEPFSGMILSLVGLTGIINLNYTRIRFNVLMFGSEKQPKGK